MCPLLWYSTSDITKNYTSCMEQVVLSDPLIRQSKLNTNINFSYTVCLIIHYKSAGDQRTVLLFFYL